jgi:hypothetical protein
MCRLLDVAPSRTGWQPIGVALTSILDRLLLLQLQQKGQIKNVA